jgi:hypothetical protein
VCSSDLGCIFTDNRCVNGKGFCENLADLGSCNGNDYCNYQFGGCVFNECENYSINSCPKGCVKNHINQKCKYDECSKYETGNEGNGEVDSCTGSENGKCEIDSEFPGHCIAGGPTNCGGIKDKDLCLEESECVYVDEDCINSECSFYVGTSCGNLDYCLVGKASELCQWDECTQYSSNAECLESGYGCSFSDGTCRSGSSNIYYVDENSDNDDKNTCGTYSNPCKTFQSGNGGANSFSNRKLYISTGNYIIPSSQAVSNSSSLLLLMLL